MAAGNRHLGYKEVLNELEDRSPGRKAAFLFGFLERGHERFAARGRRASATSWGSAAVCGAPTPGDVCAFCRLRSQVGAIELPVVDDRRRGALTWPAPSPPATACCSSTPSGAATSSPSPRAASSTRTPGCSRTTTSSASPRA